MFHAMLKLARSGPVEQRHEGPGETLRASLLKDQLWLSLSSPADLVLLLRCLVQLVL